MLKNAYAKSLQARVSVAFIPTYPRPLTPISYSPHRKQLFWQESLGEYPTSDIPKSDNTFFDELTNPGGPQTYATASLMSSVEMACNGFPINPDQDLARVIYSLILSRAWASKLCAGLNVGAKNVLSDAQPKDNVIWASCPVRLVSGRELTIWALAPFHPLSANAWNAENSLSKRMSRTVLLI
ncbi:MAG: hypothetical protein CM15mP125_0630 [Gammaproteobacteria bacterium]|nr:MAG: hypothetical protein CM15mP125_0630 [Gammaproteobacteria bacterium]